MELDPCRKNQKFRITTKGTNNTKEKAE